MLALCFVALTTPAAPPEDDIEKAVLALIQVLRHPDANSKKLAESGRAIKALIAIGKPAVPHLLDVILAKNDRALGYSQYVLKQMPESETSEEFAKRWEKLGTADRWKIVPYNPRYADVSKFVLENLDSKDVSFRSFAWGEVLRNPRAMVYRPVKDRYLKALAGDEDPIIRWMMISDETLFDDQKEVDLHIALLKPDSWAAKGDGLPPYDGSGPPWQPDGRIHVVEALGRRKAKRAAPAMLTLLAEKGQGKAYMGSVIIPLLGEFGHKEAIPELKRIVNAKEEEFGQSGDGPPRLRARAARTLWKLGDTSGRALVAEQLKSERWFDRRFAAETLELYGTKEDIPLLTAALDDKDGGVLDHACRALARILGEKVSDPRWGRGGGDAPLWKEWLKKNPQK